MTSRVSLLNKLCSLNLCEGCDMEKLYDRLSTTNIDLEEQLWITLILRSLPDSYGESAGRRLNHAIGEVEVANMMKSSTENGK